MAAPDQRRYCFLTACRNEQLILEQFLGEFREMLERTAIAARTTLYVVDDLSFDRSREVLQRYAASAPFRLVVIPAPTNLGNQGAMFLGLQQVDLGPADVLITLDCDGEDDVREVPSIIAEGERSPGSVVLIERGSRTESLRFKLFFAIYKAMFRSLTRRQIVPNNFMLVPGRYVPAFRRSPLAAVHFAYALYKLAPPHVAVIRDRRPRYGGNTSQNLFMLVSHGLVGLMVFYEVVVAKLFMFLGLFSGTAVALVALGIALAGAGELPQRLLSWSAIGLAFGAVAALGLLVSAGLALIFKVMMCRLSLGDVRPAAETPPPAGAGLAPGDARGGTADRAARSGGAAGAPDVTAAAPDGAGA
jgi:glycosyltransferase involved in cell wall biosynthesis